MRIVALLAVLALTGCSAPGPPAPPAPPARPALKTVALPDITTAAEPVQMQIRARYASLTATIEKRDAAPGELAAAYGDMGRLFIATEHLDAAEACFENAEMLVSTDMRWPYYLGHVFRLKNDPGKAASAFERSLAIKGDHVPSLVWLAEMRLTLNDPQAAEPLLTRARDLQPDDAAVLYGLGRVALTRQDYAHAVDALERALKAAPAGTRIHYPLAMAYRGLGKTALADAHLRQRGTGDVLPADPLIGELGDLLQNASAYEERGARALEAKQWPEAVTQLSKAIALAPNNAFTHLNLGTAYYMQGDAGHALEQYREAVRLSPSLAQAHFVMGLLLESRAQDREAIDAFTAAVTNDPANLDARFSLANALRRNGRIEDSLAHYSEILRANPSMSQASFGYAMGLVRLGRYPEARDRLDAAVKAFPDQLGFAHALARLLAAAPDDRVRDGARANAIMTRLVTQQRTINLAETMAMTQAELGRFDEAVRWQREAIGVARQSGRADTARLAETLRLYEARKPCRTPWADDDPVFHPAPSS